MADKNEFVLGWMSGWAAATNALTQSLNLPLQRGGSARAAPAAALAETSGNKPAGRRRGRPPKSASMPQAQGPRRRGRPPKLRTP
jgi:hypothetical protein